MARLDHYFVAEGEMLPRWREAFPDARAYRFDCLPAAHNGIMTWVRLPSGRAPAEVLAEVQGKLGGVPCIVLSDQPSDDEAIACFAAAARGYCNSHAAPQVLQQVAGVVAQGGLWIGEALMRRLLAATAHLPLSQAGSAAPDWSAALTEREREVAQTVASGASNKEIARQLGITERTVKAHVGAVLEKLGVRDRLQLAVKIGRR